MEDLKIGNTSLSVSLVEKLKGKNKEEILAIRGDLHPRIVDEFLKIYPTNRKVVEKPSKKNDGKDSE